ncbi:O-antigen ligase family protein [Novosphingobium sp. ZN18A2]|uniref:O-antigen ligase family protein n=1 Tax=Novosphingobium sp. ZN18A2 TaxID=3079861 RepID=UPI0030D4B6A2
MPRLPAQIAAPQVAIQASSWHDLQALTPVTIPIADPVPEGRMPGPVRIGISRRGEVLHLLPLLALIYSFLLFPPEVHFYVFGINLPVYRLLSILLSWYPAWGFASRRLRFDIADGLILLASVWMAVSFMHVYGSGTGFVRASGNIVDFAFPYFIARAGLRTPGDVRTLFLLLVPGLMLAGIEMMVESLARQFIVRPAFTGIFGHMPAYDNGDVAGDLHIRKEFRLGGLLRAFGPFSHPILGGVVLTSTLLVYLKGGIRGWPRFAGLAAASMGFFALSSASVIAILASAGIYVADFALSWFRRIGWWIAILFVLLAAFAVEFGSKGGLINILIRMTIDPQTGYYRKLIWQYGLQSIANHPVFGIGYAEYDRPLYLVPSASVDAHFLAEGIRHGVIVPASLMAAIVITMVRLGIAIGQGRGTDRDTLFAFNCALFVLALSSMTVTYFGEARIWFMAMIGIGASMAQLRLVRMPDRAAAVPNRPGAHSPAR